jgi:hypothetical protein
MSEVTWKVGDWAVFDRGIFQIKEIRESGSIEVSDGVCSTFGYLSDRLRPLTLRNKRIGEWFDFYYRELGRINGERGFNYPDINRHFNELALRAIDGADEDKEPYEQATEFVRMARDYTPVIQGVPLFRAAA